MATKRKQTGQRPVKSPTPSVGSSILRERTDSEMNFGDIKQAADEVEKDLTPTEGVKFKKYCEGLEKAMTDKADFKGRKIIVAVDLLIKQLGLYKQSKPRIKTFCKKLDNLKKLMEDGGRFQLTSSNDSHNSLPRLVTPVAAKTQPGSRSPVHRKQQQENIHEQTPTNNLTVDGKSAVVDKRPGSNKHSSRDDKTEKKLFEEIKEANKNLADLVKELQIKHSELIGNTQGVLLDNADSPAALVSDLRHLTKSFATHIEQNKHKAETMGINKVSLGKKLTVVVNQWLSALKTDIEKGKWTASFEGDTPDELITTRKLLLDITKCLTNTSEREQTIRNEHKTLTSQLQDSEKRILKIWKLLANGKDTSTEPSASDALNKLETFVTETKQSADKQTKEAKSLEEQLEKLEEKVADLSKVKIKQNDKIVSPSQRVKDIREAITKWKNEDQSGKDKESKGKQLSTKITKVWLQIKSGNDNGGDSIAMLEELENWLKETKALIDNLRSTDQEMKAELEHLKQDLDRFDEREYSAETVVKERKDDQEVVKIIKTLRTTLKEKQNELFSAAKFRLAEQRKIKDHVAALRQIAFGSKTEGKGNTNAGDDDRDVASQLKDIAKQLQTLEDVSAKIEEHCSKVHVALTGKQIEPLQVESSIEYLTLSEKTLQNIESESSYIASVCVETQKESLGEQFQPGNVKSSAECLTDYLATLKKLKQVNLEVESAKESCGQLSKDLQSTLSTLSDIFQCFEPEMNVKHTENKPQWMHGLIIDVKKVDIFAKHYRGKIVNNETIVEALERMYESIMQETYAKKRDPKAKSQNAKESKNDPLETIKDIDKKVSERLNMATRIKDQLEQDNSDLKIRIQELRSKLEELDKEKASLLNRLSKMAGANLTDNNPNIADLSDPNRPTKLAEMYSELYDNAWTDAYEELEKSGKDEKVHIDTLYSILAESYMACKDISRQQLMDIVIALTEPKTQESPSKGKSSGDAKLSALQSKAVTELRKQSADVFAKTLQTFMKEKWKKGKTTRSWFDKERLQTYTMNCIQLCWYMHVQAPPVYIDLQVKSGEKFDTNKFKEYMKSGKKVDFVVWPPLLLHEGGSLLSKGVAQGK